MCGICCFLRYSTPGTAEADLKQLLTGLKALEFKGYDSSGLAFTRPDAPGGIEILRSTGSSDDLKDLVKIAGPSTEVSETGMSMGHTRWATHGSSQHVKNCHPHSSDSKNEFVVVHNGIIENHRDLVQLLLRKGYSAEDFVSETDTEVVAKLAHYIYHSNQGRTFIEVVDMVCFMISGAYSLVFLSSLFPGECVATCKGSPLVIGLRGDRYMGKYIRVTPKKSNRCTSCEEAGIPPYDQDGYINTEAPSAPASPEANQDDVFGTGPAELFISSDHEGIDWLAVRSIQIKDYDVAHISSNGDLSIHKASMDDMIKEGSDDMAREILQRDAELQQVMKGDHATFMLKEIKEQPESILNCIRGRITTGIIRLDGEEQEQPRVVMAGLQNYMKDNTFTCLSRMIFVGSGTSMHSIKATLALLEEMINAPPVVEDASCFIDRQCQRNVSRNEAVVFVSQSGENEHTCEVLESVMETGCVRVGITNVVGSTISRDTQVGCHIRAGPQIAIASTKAYTSQILALNMLACLIGSDSRSKLEKVKDILNACAALPDQLRKVLTLDSVIADLAERLIKMLPHGPYLMVGRGPSVGTVLEGALKFKEVTFLPCQGVPAGELKHGPLAQVDVGMPVIVVIPVDSVYEKCLSAVQQLTARKAKIVAITTEGESQLEDIEGVDTVIKVPLTEESLQAILTVVPLQLLAYHMAILKGRGVDKEGQRIFNQPQPKGEATN